MIARRKVNGGQLEPDFLLFDDPTSGLDPNTAREIEELILKLREERKMVAIVDDCSN